MPKHVPIETVEVGDLVFVSWSQGDVKHTAQARIAAIKFDGLTRVLISEQGHAFARYELDRPRQTVCLMIDKHVPASPDLFGGFTPDLMRQYAERWAS